MNEVEEPPHKKNFTKNFFKKIFSFLNKNQKKNKISDLIQGILNFIDKNQNLLLKEGNERKLLENQVLIHELEIIKDLIMFYEVSLEEIKIPRNKIISIDEDEIFEIFNIFKKNNVSNIIVYNQNLDNIKGFINIKDLIYLDEKVLSKANFVQNEDYINLIKKPLIVPPTMKAIDLLSKMKKDNIYIAILVDEHGGTDGIVTLDNLISKIIGDRYDSEKLFFVEHKSELDFEVDSMIPIDILEEKIGKIDYDYDNIETLNGLIISFANQIPKINSEIKLNKNYICKILQIDDRKIKKVLIKKIIEIL